MTGNRHLIDTNIIVEIFDGNKVIADKISSLDGFYISSVVLGELYVGVNRVSNKAKHLKKLNDLLKVCKVIDINSATAVIYGEQMARLYKKGKPIPINDIWIAASAIQHDLIVVTNDKHFKEIADVKIENWQTA